MVWQYRKQKAEYRIQKAESSKQDAATAGAAASAADADEKRCNEILNECRGLFPDLTDYQETSLRGYLKALGPEVVQGAIQKSGRNGARSWAYLDTILSAWSSSGPPGGRQKSGGRPAATPAGTEALRDEFDWMDKFLAEHGGEES